MLKYVVSFLLLSFQMAMAAPAVTPPKEWVMEIKNCKNFAQYSNFKTKLRTLLSEGTAVVERKMNRSQIVVALSGKTSVGDIKTALNQMTQDASDAKIEWKVIEENDVPVFAVEFIDPPKT